MGPYSSGDKSIKISYDIEEEDKELDSQELPLSPLQDLFWPSLFHKLTFTFFAKSHHLLNICETCHTKYFTYIPILHFKYTVKIHKHV